MPCFSTTYTTTIQWKHEDLINKMLCQKIWELYYSCKMDIYTIKSTHCKYNCNQPCLTLFRSCILLACHNYNAIIVQLWHIWSCHVCAFSLAVKYDTFNLYTTNYAIKLSLYKYYFLTILWLLFNYFIMIF
jgi:hypothetical protein